MSNFGDLPPEFSEYDTAKVAILPIPYDVSSTWMKGSEKGPDAIIEASANMELYDIETNSEVFKQGVFTCDPIEADNAEEMVDKARAKTSELLSDGKLVVALGGEHSVSLGPIQAYHKRYPGMSVLHLDAHADTRDTYHDDKLSHACIMARVKELTKETVSVGIRSMDASEVKGLDRSRYFFAHDIHGRQGWVDEVIRKLNDQVYITIDLDVFDAGIMPSTGTPEPGGLGWYDVLGLLREVAKHKSIVGFDVVELCPGENKAPNFLAAKLIYTLLSHRFVK